MFDSIPSTAFGGTGCYASLRRTTHNVQRVAIPGAGIGEHWQIDCPHHLVRYLHLLGQGKER